MTIPEPVPFGAFYASELNVSLTVNDLNASLAWYNDVVGFIASNKHERGGKLVAVSLQAGNVRILPNQGDESQGADHTKGVGISKRLQAGYFIDKVTPI